MTVERDQIIEAAARARLRKRQRSTGGLLDWDQMTDPQRFPLLDEAAFWHDAMLPLIRQQTERETLLAAGQKIRDWAEEKFPLPRNQAQRAFHRHLQVAARIVEPELTDDEIRAGLAELLGGMADRRAARPLDTANTEEHR